MHSVAYLLCELKSRDLDSRALIAAYLLKSGIPVVVGQKWGIWANKLTSPRGCYLFATANSIQGADMVEVRDAGHMVIASDEEALPLVDSIANVAPNAVEACDKFLVDTEAHKSILVARYGHAAEKFIVSGSPRLEAIRTTEFEPIGGSPYILFNTSFALINSVWGDLRTALTTFLSGSDFGEEDARLWLEAERAAYDLVVPLVGYFCTRYRVVMRPHPAERAQTWRDTFPDVEVVEGTLSLPWISSSKVMVHANSTTGLEAALMRVPAINLNPIPAYGDRYVLKEINKTVSTAQDAINALESILEDQRGSQLEKSSMDALFPPDGAKSTARSIVSELGDTQKLSGDFPWRPLAHRTDTQKSKFTVSREEFQASLDRAMATVGTTPCQIRTLDDSVFLAVP